MKKRKLIMHKQSCLLEHFAERITVKSPIRLIELRIMKPIIFQLLEVALDNLSGWEPELKKIRSVDYETFKKKN